jgi:hypothetical protein
LPPVTAPFRPQGLPACCLRQIVPLPCPTRQTSRCSVCLGQASSISPIPVLSLRLKQADISIHCSFVTCSTAFRRTQIRRKVFPLFHNFVGLLLGGCRDSHSAVLRTRHGCHFTPSHWRPHARSPMCRTAPPCGRDCPNGRFSMPVPADFAALRLPIPGSQSARDLRTRCLPASFEPPDRADRRYALTATALRFSFCYPPRPRRPRFSRTTGSRAYSAVGPTATRHLLRRRREAAGFPFILRRGDTCVTPLLRRSPSLFFRFTQKETRLPFAPSPSRLLSQSPGRRSAAPSGRNCPDGRFCQTLSANVHITHVFLTLFPQLLKKIRSNLSFD